LELIFLLICWYFYGFLSLMPYRYLFNWLMTAPVSADGRYSQWPDHTGMPGAGTALMADILPD
jgi:hypothetical protein